MRKDICFIDFETTGNDLYNDYPIQLGAVLLSSPDNRILREFDSLIRPPNNASMSETAFRIHGYQIEDLKDAPASHDVLKLFFDQMKLEYSFGGWNIAFDVGFFRRMCYETGYIREYKAISHRHMDVQSIVRGLVDAGLLPDNVESLGSFCEFAGIKRPKRHSALGDARITAEIYVYLIRKLCGQSPAFAYKGVFS